MQIVFAFHGELDLTVLGDSFRCHCGGGIVNVKVSNSPKINLLKPVNISAWCGPCVCVGHERTTQFFRLRRPPTNK